jgi:5-methylcytosine-specific restriction protein A
MKQNEADRLALNLTRQYGLPMRVSNESRLQNNTVILEPVGVHSSEAYSVKIVVGWRSISFEFVPGKFSAGLIEQMEESTDADKIAFASLAKHIQNEKGTLEIRINDQSCNPVDISSWPNGWRFLKINMVKSPLEINTEDQTKTEKLLNQWTERFFGLVIALSPLEENSFDESVEGLSEGAVSQVQINRYERSRYNRSLCVNFHGDKCRICGFDFSKKYGDIGTGFIHVHHITPVSKLGSDYIIDPINDLIPVCPNCHAMLHKKDPPYTMEEIKGMMN